MTNPHQFYVPPEGPPQGINLNPEIFLKMGNENIFKMISDFYTELGQSEIAHLFPKDMSESIDRSTAFFVFLLGGPPLYQEKYGPPMMRRRHLPFAIDEHARSVWLRCFQAILKNAPEKYHFPTEHLDAFWEFLQKFSGWMVNTK